MTVKMMKLRSGFKVLEKYTDVNENSLGLFNALKVHYDEVPAKSQQTT